MNIPEGPCHMGTQVLTPCYKESRLHYTHALSPAEAGPPPGTAATSIPSCRMEFPGPYIYQAGTEIQVMSPESVVSNQMLTIAKSSHRTYNPVGRSVWHLAGINAYSLEEWMERRQLQDNMGLSQRQEMKSGRDFRRTVSVLQSWEEQRVLLSGGWMCGLYVQPQGSSFTVGALGWN